jgi:EmrB/QacA subfamily drug resistance transporter
VPKVRIVPLIVACALLMENLDGTVIATSLPAIAADVNESPLSLKLALTSYLVALAIFIPASGWVADKFGARRVFRIALLIFVAGSILCGMSDSLWGFVAARFLQGMGGSMMTPVGRLLVVRSAPRHELVEAFAWLTVPAMIGPVLGPPVGGFITTYLHWRWIFWINVPIGILGIVLATLYIPNVREDDPGRLDVTGFILSALGLSGLVFGLTVAGRGFVSNIADAVMIGGGAAMIAAYVFHARRAANPILDLSLMRIPTFRASVGGGFLFRLSVGAVPFLLPLMLQLGFGMSPFESGMLTFASAIGAMAMKTSAGYILRTYGFKRTLIINGLICSAFFMVYGLFQPTTPHWAIVGVLLVGGFFRSLQFTALNTLGYADIDNARMSKATSFSATGQQVAMAMGVTVGAAAVEIARYYHGEAAISLDDFTPGFYTVGVISLISILTFFNLSKSSGEHLSKRTPGPAARANAAADDADKPLAAE